MLRFLCGNADKTPTLNKRFCEFAAQVIFGKENDFGPCGTLGIFRDNRLIAVIVFNGWQPQYGIIEISAGAISPAWLCKRSIREIMAICFDQHHCQQIVSRMATDNERAIRIYEFLGFTHIRLPNLRGSGKDEWLQLLTLDQWKAHKFYEAAP